MMEESLPVLDADLKYSSIHSLSTNAALLAISAALHLFEALNVKV